MTSSVEASRRQPFLRAPPAVVWLVLFLLCAHAARVVFFAGAETSWFFEYGLVPARYSHSYLVSHGVNPGNILDRALPFVTYMFLHANFTHVVANSVWLLAFGPVVARRFGTWLFLAFFLVCGIAGAGLHLAWNWGSDSPVIGASAAVSGLMAAAFRMLPLPPAAGRALAPILSARILLWSALWAIVNVVAGLTGFGTGGHVEVVAWQAHMGGYAAGLFLAGPFNSLARRNEPAQSPA